MKKGEVYEGVVERVAFPNKGIVSFGDGGRAVVKDVVPGQRISFSVRKAHQGRVEGRLLEVLVPSPLELSEAPCPHFGVCGGCAWLTLPPDEQRRLKERQVRELLEPVLAPYRAMDEVFEGVKPSPRQFGYRNKMEFSFGDMEKGGPLTLGLHKRGSFYDIVPVAGCKIADEDFGHLLACALSFFREKGIPYYHKLSHEGYLRHLLVRKATRTGEILLDLVTTSQMGEAAEQALLAEFVEVLLAQPLSGHLVGILHTRNDSLADAVLDGGTDVLHGQGYFYEELLGLRFQITPFSFFQTNSLGAEVLYKTAREYVADAGDGGVVFDLYSGTGTIAQLLAGVARKVVGVELVEEAVLAARENARQNGLPNCEFLAGDVLKVLDSIEERPDVIVLDPPRDGVHPKALGRIVAYGARRIVYISCKPTSLARDLPSLLAGGYEVRRMCCVDMFPGTSGIETVCALSRME